MLLQFEMVMDALQEDPGTTSRGAAEASRLRGKLITTAAISTEATTAAATAALSSAATAAIVREQLHPPGRRQAPYVLGRRRWATATTTAITNHRH